VSDWGSPPPASSSDVTPHAAPIQKMNNAAKANAIGKDFQDDFDDFSIEILLHKFNWS
jgi:hypothetical protein